MRPKHISIILSMLALLVITGWNGQPQNERAAPAQAIQAPALKWLYGGCTSWCETGWYSSPAVADLDGDGAMEIIASAYSIAVLDGDTGALKWRMKSGHDRSEGTSPNNVGRTWPGIVVADVDNDGLPEIVTAHSGGYVSVYDQEGYFQSGWPQRPTTSELRGLSVYDLDSDGTLEIVVTGAIGSKTNTWVLEHTGALRSGWPQLNNDSGYAWGVYNDNATVGDVDGDGVGEIIVPSDVHYINAYEANGVQIPAHSMYGGKGWGKVGVHVDHAVDLRGYAHCGTEHRPNFAHTPATMADMNGDGVQEVVAMGNVYNCGTSPYTSLYEMPFIFNADRSRWSSGSFDWEVIPVPDGNAGPISESYNDIESNMSNPVAADLDGDGNKEILYPSYDGRMHVYWLDKTEHGNWPFSVYNPGEGFYRFASEPAVADLDNDGRAEVIFASWTQKGSNQWGKLHILDYLGNVLHEITLPAPEGDDRDWNGALPAPTVANIDSDADLEVVLNTAHAGFVAYDLPGTANARVLWGTGRGSYQRNGALPKGYVETSVQPVAPEANDVLTYTIRIKNPGPIRTQARLTDTLPPGVTYLGNLWASTGSYGEAGGVITWTGMMLSAQPVTITFGATVNSDITDPQVLETTPIFNDGLGNVYSLPKMMAIANAWPVYLPLITRN